MLKDEIEVTVDGASYRLSQLSEEARAQVTSLQYVDAQIADLNAKLAVFTTARAAYENALQQLLPHTRQ